MRALVKELLLLTVLLLMAGQAAASDLIAALHAQKYAEIEGLISTAETKLLRGELSEYDALQLIKPFYQHEDILSTDLNRWVRQRPNSYVAYLVRGTYHIKLGEFRRGENYIQQVPEANVQYMQHQFELAKLDYNKALGLNPRSYLTLLYLMNLAMYEDDDHAAKRILREADKVKKDNLLVRARYLVHLEPRWGGSYDQMDRFIDETRHTGAPECVVKLLRAVKYADLGLTEEEASAYVDADASYIRSLTLASACNADGRFIQSYLGNAASWRRENQTN